MQHTFCTVDKLVTGPGCFEKLGELAREWGSRALLVTGRRAMREAGVTDRACDLLARSGVEPRLFEGISAEPTDAECDAGRALCREERCDLVIGIGGGSAMDAAKTLAALVSADRPTAEYVLGRATDAAGVASVHRGAHNEWDGAEVTPNAVLCAPERRVKSSIRGAGILPRVALVDPDLTLTCPPDVTAASGIDALAQAIESYVSIHASPVTEALSFRAAELLLAQLAEAVADGANRAAREACSYGSLMAGMGLANARLGVVHGIAHPLGVRYHIPHGVCCGALLAASIRLNREAAAEKYGRLSAAAGGDIERVIRALVDQIGIANAFAKYPIRENDFAAIVAESMPSGSLKANPKKVTEEDVVSMLREVMSECRI